MSLIYLAHPVAPLPGSTETLETNLADAEWWLTALQRANPDVAIIAPWIQELRLCIGDDSDPESRRRGLARCRIAASRCDEIILCGQRISRGMLQELEAYRSRSAPWVVHRFLHREQCLDLGVTRCQLPGQPVRSGILPVVLPLDLVRRLPAVGRGGRSRDPRRRAALRGGAVVTTIDKISPAPWRRGQWHGSLVSVDGTRTEDFVRDDVARVVAWGTTDASDWDGETAGVALLKDGRYISWEASWGPTGNGSSEDAYGGESDIFFADEPRVAASALSEKARELLGEEWR